jgi:hypothetical protein
METIKYPVKLGDKIYCTVDDEWAVLLWYYHLKAVEVKSEDFYDLIVQQILNEKGFFEEILVPLAKILKIKKGVPIDKFYKKLCQITPLSPSKIIEIRKLYGNH